MTENMLKVLPKLTGEERQHLAFTLGIEPRVLPFRSQDKMIEMLGSLLNAAPGCTCETCAFMQRILSKIREAQHD